MLTTPLCRQLGIELPILNAPMGVGIAGPELAAAVSNAGGLGTLGSVPLASSIGEQIRRTRALTSKPFLANLVIAVLQGDELAACFDAGPPILGLFGGDPRPFVQDAHRRGIKVIPQVASVAEAVAAVEGGVDAIIAQGVEAGGHVLGTTSLSVVVPAIVDAVRPVPVIAAGGIADGRGLVAALALGAQAVSMGTRFLASDEAAVSPVYKELITRSRAEETVLTELFNIGWNAPHRVLRNRAVSEWEDAGHPPPGKRPGEGTIIGRVNVAGQPMELPRYSAIPPLPGFEGDAEYYCLYAGESCTLVNDIRPAAAIVRDIIREAEHVGR
jgi:nitronate monooxygenase/enoyl-[acyl-carrier protein] reductase II